jgi:hypothetical protein
MGVGTVEGDKTSDYVGTCNWSLTPQLEQGGVGRLHGGQREQYPSPHPSSPFQAP